MASGSLGGRTTYNSSYQSIGINWSSSTNISNNTSQLSISLFWNTSNSSKRWDTVAARDAYIKVYVNGVETYSDNFSMRFDCDPYPSIPYVFRTYSCTIYHNADGTPPVVQIAAYANGTAKSSGTNWGPGKSYVDAQSIYLDTIPRASSFSFSGTTLGSNTHVSISRASSSFTHRVKYVMGDITQNYTDIGTVCDFTRPYTDAQQFASNSASGTGSITVITYNGGAEIGRTSKNIVMTLPDNNDTKPVMNSETVISDSITEIETKFGAFIQNKSKPQFTFDYSGRYGANISEYSVSINDKIYTSSSNSVIVDEIRDSGSINYTYKIKDTRGRITNGNGIISVVEYNNPQISTSIERTSAGNSASVQLNVSITALNNLNDKSVAIKYKPHLETNYYSINVPFDEGEYTMDKTISVPISENLSYDFYVQAIDFFGEEDTVIIPISTVFDLLHFSADGESIAVGKRVERENCFEIGMDLYYKGMSIDDYIRQIINERNDD